MEGVNIMEKDKELWKRLQNIAENENFEKYPGNIYDDEFDEKLMECVLEYALERKEKEEVIA